MSDKEETLKREIEELKEKLVQAKILELQNHDLIVEKRHKDSEIERLKDKISKMSGSGSQNNDHTNTNELNEELVQLRAASQKARILELQNRDLIDEKRHLQAKIERLSEKTLKVEKATAQMLLPVVSFESDFEKNFEPISILGLGGYGCVFEAKSKLMKRSYAIKRIPLIIKNDSDLEKALEEAKALDSFEHPGIVKYNHTWIEKPTKGWQRLFDGRLVSSLRSKELLGREMEIIDTFEQSMYSLSDDSSFLYIQMQLCKSTLADWLADNEERSSKRLKSWFKQVVEAVDYIHKQKKMHRDLKPSNILIVSDDKVKICDLGIATEIGKTEGSLTWRTSIGTETYKAPEQTRMYDRRVDIFSLGLILVELCLKMTEDQKSEVFNDIRCGVPLEILKEQEAAFDLATKLTKLKRDERPTMEIILSHPFFD